MHTLERVTQWPSAAPVLHVVETIESRSAEKKPTAKPAPRGYPHALWFWAVEGEVQARETDPSSQGVAGLQSRPLDP